MEEEADEAVSVEGVPLRAICQYRLGDMSPEETLAILGRRQLALIGGRTHASEEYGSACCVEPGSVTGFHPLPEDARISAHEIYEDARRR